MSLNHIVTRKTIALNMRASWNRHHKANSTRTKCFSNIEVELEPQSFLCGCGCLRFTLNGLKQNGVVVASSFSNNIWIASASLPSSKIWTHQNSYPKWKVNSRSWRLTVSTPLINECITHRCNARQDWQLDVSIKHRDTNYINLSTVESCATGRSNNQTLVFYHGHEYLRQWSLRCKCAAIIIS